MKTPVGYSCIMIVLALCLSEHLAAQNTSPCNQGRAEDFGEVDPRHVNAICLPELGRMIGTITPCERFGIGEEFGRQITPLGDVSGDGLADFLVEHQLCDSPSHGGPPIELLLYKGVQGGVPKVEIGDRIGPIDRLSQSSYIAHGDFDADGYIDIAVRVRLMYDSSFGNNGYDISSLVVFWGSSGGHYSTHDTTHLACEGQAWMFINRSVAVDIDADGLTDLCAVAWYGFTGGQPIPIPIMQIFRGRSGERWGRNGVSRTADWTWWNSPALDRVVLLDQDNDGAIDIGFHNDQSVGTGFVSVLYGKSHAMPDTAEFETIDLSISNGHVSQFLDISGDGVPELIVTSGSENTIKVFIGLKGQRLQEQYGTGIDPPNPDSARWWGKPWCQLWLPKKINANWFYDYYRLFDLGDANRDGYNDIYTISWPYLLCYTGGKYMDSLVDALVDVRPGAGVATATVVGNIDGSGKQTMAISYDGDHATPTPFPGGIIFVQPSNDVPSQWYQERKYPERTLAGTQDAAREENTDRLHLRALPNPARREVSIAWQGERESGSATITISDTEGRIITSFPVETTSSSALWIPENSPPGIYFIRLQTSVSNATTQVVLQ